MKTLSAMIIILLMTGMAGGSVSFAHELSGYVSGEGTVFFRHSLFPGQKRSDLSFALHPEYYHEWDNGWAFTLIPFARLDRADPERSHFDIRELNYLLLGDTWELRVGIGKVFWGVTEFVHLIDIINQTDLVENIDTEDKLGQPMIHLSFIRHWGVIDAFVMPYFRERTFPGRQGRLRFSLIVDTDNARYESENGRHQIDLALRYSHTIGDWDIGFYHFNGTGREPTLLSDVNEHNEPVLIPFYEQINQVGLDVQRLAGQWLFKLEALYRTGQGNGFLAGITGFEYTFVRVAGTRMDLGIVGEWAYDERGDSAATPFQNDAVAGVRLALNDPASSELLAGVLQDMTSSARAVQIEASRRLGARWRANVEARAFFDLSENDLLYSLRNDDFLRLELACYF